MRWRRNGATQDPIMSSASVYLVMLRYGLKDTNGVLLIGDEHEPVAVPEPRSKVGAEDIDEAEVDAGIDERCEPDSYSDV